jgi:hypothetical protein
MFEIKPTPMPCMNRTRSRVFDVCGRSQYDSCLGGDCLGLVISTASRGGKTSMQVARVQWESKPDHSIRICVIVLTIVINIFLLELIPSTRYVRMQCRLTKYHDKLLRFIATEYNVSPNPFTFGLSFPSRRPTSFSIPCT